MALQEISCKPLASPDWITHRISPEDMVIAVMGPTGAGKSTFIKHATGSDQVTVGHSLKSCTDKVTAVCCPHPNGSGRHVVFVDTIGFDDTNLTDVDVLDSIATWLNETYQQKIKLSGLLYCHRISDNRIGGSPAKNLRVFRDLCGNGALKNVILVTTMWDEVNLETGQAREEELSTSFWDTMLGLGARTARYHSTYESAWTVIKLLATATPLPTKIQKEMGDRHLPLGKTTAGRSLLGRLKEFLAALRKRLLNLLPLMKNPEIAKEYSRLQEEFVTVERQKTMLSRSSSLTSLRRNVTPPPRLVACAPNVHSPDVFPRLGPAEMAMETTTTILRHVQGAPVPFLREVSGVVIEIAERVYRMRLTKPEIINVVNGAGTLLGTIIANGESLETVDREMHGALLDFNRSLQSVLAALKDVERRGVITRYVFLDNEEAIVSTCDRSMARASALFNIQLNIHHAQVLARIEANLVQLNDRLTIAVNTRTPSPPLAEVLGFFVNERGPSVTISPPSNSC